MKLNIIAGKLKGRVIKISGRCADFRPTKSMVREGLAAMLNPNIRNVFVADLCAGSGAFGFEMLSRGAKEVHFVDNNRLLCNTIISHTQEFKVDQYCKIFARDIRSFLKTCSCLYDIVFFDPPYRNKTLANILPDVLKIVSNNGILIFEHGKLKKQDNTDLKFNTSEFTLESRKFGKTELDIFNRIG